MGVKEKIAFKQKLFQETKVSERYKELILYIKSKTKELKELKVEKGEFDARKNEIKTKLNKKIEELENFNYEVIINKIVDENKNMPQEKRVGEKDVKLILEELKDDIKAKQDFKKEDINEAMNEFNEVVLNLDNSAELFDDNDDDELDEMPPPPEMPNEGIGFVRGSNEADEQVSVEQQEKGNIAKNNIPENVPEGAKDLLAELKALHNQARKNANQDTSSGSFEEEKPNAPSTFLKSINLRKTNQVVNKSSNKGSSSLLGQLNDFIRARKEEGKLDDISGDVNKKSWDSESKTTTQENKVSYKSKEERESDKIKAKIDFGKELLEKSTKEMFDINKYDEKNGKLYFHSSYADVKKGIVDEIFSINLNSKDQNLEMLVQADYGAKDELIEGKQDKYVKITDYKIDDNKILILKELLKEYKEKQKIFQDRLAKAKTDNSFTPIRSVLRNAMTQRKNDMRSQELIDEIIDPFNKEYNKLKERVGFLNNISNKNEQKNVCEQLRNELIKLKEKALNELNEEKEAIENVSDSEYSEEELEHTEREIIKAFEKLNNKIKIIEKQEKILNIKEKPAKSKATEDIDVYEQTNLQEQAENEDQEKVVDSAQVQAKEQKNSTNLEQSKENIDEPKQSKVQQTKQKIKQVEKQKENIFSDVQKIKDSRDVPKIPTKENRPKISQIKNQVKQNKISVKQKVRGKTPAKPAQVQQKIDIKGKLKSTFVKMSSGEQEINSKKIANKKTKNLLFNKIETNLKQNSHVKIKEDFQQIKFYVKNYVDTYNINPTKDRKGKLIKSTKVEYVEDETKLSLSRNKETFAKIESSGKKSTKITFAKCYDGEIKKNNIFFVLDSLKNIDQSKVFVIGKCANHPKTAMKLYLNCILKNRSPELNSNDGTLSSIKGTEFEVVYNSCQMMINKGELFKPENLEKIQKYYDNKFKTPKPKQSVQMTNKPQI